MLPASLSGLWRLLARLRSVRRVPGFRDPEAGRPALSVTPGLLVAPRKEGLSGLWLSPCLLPGDLALYEFGGDADVTLRRREADWRGRLALLSFEGVFERL